MVPYDNFMPFPCMESYVSMHGIVWNHMVPCMELYGNIWFHAWNRMELYNCRLEIGLNHMENEGNHCNDILKYRKNFKKKQKKLRGNKI